MKLNREAIGILNYDKTYFYACCLSLHPALLLTCIQNFFEPRFLLIMQKLYYFIKQTVFFTAIEDSILVNILKRNILISTETKNLSLLKSSFRKTLNKLAKKEQTCVNIFPKFVLQLTTLSKLNIKINLLLL